MKFHVFALSLLFLLPACATQNPNLKERVSVLERELAAQQQNHAENFLQRDQARQVMFQQNAEAVAHRIENASYQEFSALGQSQGQFGKNIIVYPLEDETLSPYTILRPVGTQAQPRKTNAVNESQTVLVYDLDDVDFAQPVSVMPLQGSVSAAPLPLKKDTVPARQHLRQLTAPTAMLDQQPDQKSGRRLTGY